jgi:hypothetical protein
VQIRKNTLFGTGNEFIESRGIKNNCQRDLVVPGNSNLGMEVKNASLVIN